MTPFSPDYFTARDRFRAAATRLGWTQHAYPIAARGPGGEELTIDVALSGEGDGRPVLLVTSGVHGVEGYFGSALQLAAFDAFERAGGPPPGVRYVFVHAVSPHGFAHGRRFDENNVDLNRNFLLDGVPFRGSPPTYALVDSTLNPPGPPNRWEPFFAKALLSIARHGYSGLKQAIAGGQYDYPKGIFFGGHGPAESQRILNAHFTTWLGAAPNVVHLDMHTGLGRWGTYKLLIDDPLTPEQTDRATKWFGPGVIEASAPEGMAYETRGGFGQWCVSQAGSRDYLFFCAEFGTYGGLTVLSAMRDENRAHVWCAPGDPARNRTRAWLKNVFAPAAHGWRATVIQRGLALVRQAVAGLQSVANVPARAAG
ncbi:DUF2817 domain-containing protein [Fimbriiglobus ruber]|uniref:DUF2817 domain-containing protein n=1 Tax=Fimbriiglobus ruber TaxID=1908690 RepID=A0A225DRL9_9BACT|nr:DUF2817 domain-containing protein [Fimbriiglobus ruber]OWK43951.1 hypothetical protein FRUB_03550 [Fimbriiglobus ruber]